MTGGGVVIVGAGPAGLAAARAYRDAGGRAPVTLLGAELHAPYQRPPLTKELLRGESEPDGLPLESESWYHEHQVELNLGVRVTGLDPDRGLLELAGAPPMAYDACVLATGSRPTMLPGTNTSTIRTVDDSLHLRGHGRRVAVVGTGFLGCEAAASLAIRGADVTLVGMEEQPHAARLGGEVGEVIAGWLRGLGVTLSMGSAVAGIENGPPAQVLQDDGSVTEADTVVQAMGAEPRLELAEDGGLTLSGGAIAADTGMRTSAQDVYVAGDAAFALNAAAGRRLRVEHWGEALEQGAVVGGVMAGQDRRWETVPGFWSSIGPYTLKYRAWGDGHARVALHRGEDGAFTAWYSDERGVCVGVLTHERDHDYERGGDLIAARGNAP
jgi:3-phenylpropionate/trans-cinnamate dioxygenase ferredoxin reductase component